MMNNRNTALIALICLVLCISLFPISASADQTVIILGGTANQESTVVTQGVTSYPGTTIISGGTGTSAIIADGSPNSIIITGQTANDSNSVIVLPDGSVVTSKPTQTVETTVQAPVQQPVEQAETDWDKFAMDLYNRINAERNKNGLGLLNYDPALQATADLRAIESSEVFGHTRPDGSAAVTAVTVNYYIAGENLIQVNKEYATVDIMVETWLNSETHRANIMMAEFNQTAIGIYEQDGTVFVSQIFTD